MDLPAFEVIQTPRGPLVVCQYTGFQGAARVFTKGVQDACDRAEAQARQKAKEAGQ